jgi:hypothetical protein
MSRPRTILFVSVGAMLFILSTLFACTSSSNSHQTYAYSYYPSFPLNTSHFVKQCGTSVSVLRTGASYPLVWPADAITISNTPVVSSTPVVIRISVALIGPYTSCRPFSGIVDSRGAILGPVAVRLPTITTDNWTGRAFAQQLTLPHRPGFYVFYEQLASKRANGSDNNGLSLEWIQILSPRSKKEASTAWKGFHYA